MLGAPATLMGAPSMSRLAAVPPFVFFFFFSFFAPLQPETTTATTAPPQIFPHSITITSIDILFLFLFSFFPFFLPIFSFRLLHLLLLHLSSPISSDYNCGGGSGAATPATHLSLKSLKLVLARKLEKRVEGDKEKK